MSTSSDLEELITLKQRRRRQLKKVQAVKGVDTNPEVLIEIEDLEAELPRLKTELVDAMQQEAEAKAPLLHLANFQPPPAALPAGVIILDWSGHFQAKPRSLPDPAVWATDLLPELAALPARLGPPGLVRLEGSAALSTGLAVGHTFPNVGRYRLSLAQHTPTGPQTWLSDAPALAGADPTFTPHIALGPTGAEDGLIVIAASPQPTLAGLLAQVGHSWGEGAGLAQLAGGGYTLQRTRGVLALEAPSLPLTESDAAGLARTFRRLLTDFIDQARPARLHLFMAAPLGLALFVGHHWNAIGLDLHCYEWLAQDHYIPSCILR